MELRYAEVWALAKEAHQTAYSMTGIEISAKRLCREQPSYDLPLGEAVDYYKALYDAVVKTGRIILEFRVNPVDLELLGMMYGRTTPAVEHMYDTVQTWGPLYMSMSDDGRIRMMWERCEELGPLCFLETGVVLNDDEVEDFKPQVRKASYDAS